MMMRTAIKSRFWFRIPQLTSHTTPDILTHWFLSLSRDKRTMSHWEVMFPTTLWSIRIGWMSPKSSTNDLCFWWDCRRVYQWDDSVSECTQIMNQQPL
jgi:hypothetical protein